MHAHQGFSPPETCPVCGADVPPRARACPECGADERTGWSEGARYDGLDLPDREFDYDAFVQEEFGGGRRPGPRRRLWYAVAVVVLLVFVWFFVIRILG
jgi:hypothetical protein